MRFSDEQQQFAKSIRAFCERECATLQQRDAITDGGRLANSPQLLEKLADLGWLGISFPERYGGAGAGFVDECIFLEETARGLAPITGYSTGLTAAQTYLRWGTEEQKRTIVQSLCRGELEAIALSEPGESPAAATVSTFTRNARVGGETSPPPKATVAMNP